MIFRTMFILLLLCCLQGCTQQVTRPTEWAVPVIGKSLSNFYQVDNNIYRSEQPSKDSLKALAGLGIKEILNLREYHKDEEAEKQQFIVHHVPMNVESVTEAQLLAALKEIKNRKAPLLIHCLHGSDRTGVTVAAYRIIFQDWSKEKAIEEMVYGGFGFHGNMSSNLVALINKMDVVKMKQRLQNGS